MNVVKIDPPGARAATDAWELGGGALLAFAALEAQEGLRDFLAAEHERLAGLLGSLDPEEVPLLLADLLTRGFAHGAPAAAVLSICKEGTAWFLTSGKAAAYVAPAAGPVRRFLPSEGVRLPLAGGALVALVAGEVPAPLEERLLAALQSARGPEGLESVLRGPLERAGGALLAFTAPGAAGESPRREVTPGVEHEIAVLRREVERRLVRLDARVKDLEDLVAGFAAAASRPRFSFPGLPSLTRPRPQPVPLRRPTLGLAEDSERDDDLPQFERGLDVPVAANWSRPLLYATGGITLLLFLALQLFCAGAERPRRLYPQPRAVPAAAPATSPATPKPPVPRGTLFVTPTNEPEGTEGG
ncbi:MAG TPA: hypothetical protein VGR07_06505, partial [Thermoanaerobaculia bacterium]|nr:hypothetical protein [Thermoanaerobaculia bacterium]